MLLSYRRATCVDAQTIAALHIENWRDVYRGILPDRYLDNFIAEERSSLWQARFSSPDADRQYILLAEVHRKPVGFVCVLLDEEPQWGACLDNLHVLPGLRNKGIGRQLFIRAARWVMATAPGVPIHLWVFEANGAARRFYDACEGKIVACQSKKIAQGVEILSVLYVWNDVQMLLDNLTLSTGVSGVGPRSYAEDTPKSITLRGP